MTVRKKLLNYLDMSTGHVQPYETLSSLTRLDDCSVLFIYTYLNDNIREGFKPHVHARRQVLKFGVNCILRGEYLCFYYMFKTNFSGHKIWEAMLPNAHSWLRAC